MLKIKFCAVIVLATALAGAAYAKGGQKVGEFSNPSQALDKAFELCPDG